jgi:hypothetical protein
MHLKLPRQIGLHLRLNASQRTYAGLGFGVAPMTSNHAMKIISTS